MTDSTRRDGEMKVTDKDLSLKSDTRNEPTLNH